MSLRTQTLKIAQDLPAGDPTRKKILAALQGKTAGKDPESILNKALATTMWETCKKIEAEAKKNHFFLDCSFYRGRLDIVANYDFKQMNAEAAEDGNPPWDEGALWDVYMDGWSDTFGGDAPQRTKLNMGRDKAVFTVSYEIDLGWLK